MKLAYEVSSKFAYFCELIFSCCPKTLKKKCACILAIATIFLTSRTLQHFMSTVQIHAQHCANRESVITDGEWYNLSNDVFRLYAFSAFYDDRPSLLSDPVIRIIAISDRFEQIKIDKLYCKLQSSTKDVVIIMEEKPKPIGFGWPLNKEAAREFIYTCPTVKGMIPDYVSIVTDTSETLSSSVPVTVPNKPKEQREFCICVQAAYGTFNPIRLIEWMELQKILGVNLVGIYVLSASDEVTKVFRHYSKEGFVDLRTMNYIYANRSDDTEKEFWLHLTPAINDCIYRHMHEFRRIVVIDFDEFIMPRNHQNLFELMTYLDHETSKAAKESIYVNFAFRNNYFFSELPSDDKFPSYLTFLRFRKKVPISPEGYSVKSIINPQACTHMHNHYCWGVTANYTEYSNTASVDPEIALNQHYKKCHFSKVECDDLMKNITQDDVMMRFEALMRKNVAQTINYIM